MVSQLVNLSLAEIFIGGTKNVDIMRDLEEIVVDSTFNMPSMATVRLHDMRGTWMQDTKLQIGKELKIKLTPARSLGTATAGADVFSGEIVSTEMEVSSQGEAYFVMRAYDRLHRLSLQTRSRTFLKQTDSAIVQKIAGEHGLSAQVDATSVQHEYVLQCNQSDMEFIAERARRNGYQIRVEEKKLFFEKVEMPSAETVITLGSTLRSLSLRMSTARQAKEAHVYGWDSVAKKEIVGTSTPSTEAKKLRTGSSGATTANSFGNDTRFVVNEVVTTADEATALAAAYALDQEGEFVEAEGVVYGYPTLLAGKRVKLALGDDMKKMEQALLVSSATHIFNPRGYETHFTVSGRYPPTMSGLLNGRDSLATAQARGLLFGAVVGIVTNTKDPDSMGRVKVKFPWMGKDAGQEVESHWARLAAPMAGPQRGVLFIPEVNDEVLVVFEQGDTRRPYIIGALWNGTDKLPDTTAVDASGKVVRRVIYTRAGHKIILDDTTGKEMIIIRDKTDNNEIIIDSSKNTIDVKAQMDINLTAQGNIKLKATRDINMECMNFNVKANVNAKVEATATLALKGTASATMEGTTAKVAGTATLNLEAGGPNTIKGMPIMLN